MSMSAEVAKAHVARLYFEHDVTKREIAQRLGISRFKVARLLDQARNEGIVRVEIQDPVDVDGELSRALERTFGLQLAVVVPTEAAIPRATGAWVGGLVLGGGLTVVFVAMAVSLVLLGGVNMAALGGGAWRHEAGVKMPAKGGTS